MSSRSSSPATTERVRSLGEVYELWRLAGAGVDLDAPALIDDTRTLSWRAAVDRIGRLASALNAHGVRRRDRVGVRMLKSVDSFVAVHAIMRAGAVMVPLDPMAPAAVAHRAADDAELTAVLVDPRSPHHRAFVDGLDTTTAVAFADRDGDDPDDRGDVRRDGVLHLDLVKHEPLTPVATASDDDAYIIYTSGSTGEPKGIVHTHASAIAYATCAVAEYGIGPDDTLANFAPLHFDQSTFELYAAPLAGASVVILGDVAMRFPASIVEVLARHRPTVWYTVPSLLTQIVRRGGLATAAVARPRLVLYGGESFRPTALRELMDALPDTTVSNVYGPAEVNQCTRHDLTDAPDDDRQIPLGRAWSAAETMVVATSDAAADQDEQPRGPDADRGEGDGGRDGADGAIGELFVRSATVMRGYWKRAEQSGATLIDNPASLGPVLQRSDPPGDSSRIGPTTRWLRTGDLVRVCDDGLMTFVGRRDHQVKIRGQRVELDDVDAVLAGAPGVAEAVAVVDPSGPDGEPTLVAVVVADEADADAAASDALERSVRQYCAARLASVAVPTRVAITERLGRTPTGKISREESRRLACCEDVSR